ncbi:hypothetical protein AXF42_Ash012995 [Apostasia shenzhenica]|uniref:FLZ-type domain-containing protein n=1 Tax=Apostasia shenzhenica TaxID=1088818 RepID=A0A2I0ARU1_9ASPA|nr:hypothetical protein AXF42_Ash012995 [Apostasia shenzhenica]
MSDNSSFLPSPNGKLSSPISSLFPSPKLLGGFSDSEATMSPTSILETKPFSVIGNPFFTERNFRKPYRANEDSRAIGLGIVDALTNEKSDKKYFIPNSRMVLLGSHLKVQIPRAHSNTISSTGSLESPHTPIEFGIKNKNSQSSFLSPMCSGGEIQPSQPIVFTGEMELSEDYTCVISYGPNPKKTHIFDNFIVESSGDMSMVVSKKESRFSDELSLGYPSEDFLSFCHACKKRLAQGKDIFMYRGEKAFCSCECRLQGMISDSEGTENCLQDLFDPF